MKGESDMMRGILVLLLYFTVCAAHTHAAGYETLAKYSLPPGTWPILLRVGPDGSEAAYITWAKNGGEGLFVNTTKITPRCSLLDFSPEHFTRTGILVFAGYFTKNGEILLARRLHNGSFPLQPPAL